MDDTRPFLRVFLGSPGDVPEERARARDVVRRLNEAPWLRETLSLKPIAWEDAALQANLTPQEAIARGLPPPRECDLAVFVFWSRMGTPLPPEYVKPDGTPYRSGTEWELCDAFEQAGREGRPFSLVYRCTRPADDSEQSRTLAAFFRSAIFLNPDGSHRGSLRTFDTPDEFEKRLAHDLQAAIHLLRAAREARTVAVPPSGGARVDIAEAQRLLGEAVRGDRWPAALARKTIDDVLSHRPRDAGEYRLGRLAAWSRPEYQLNKRFVRLTLLVDRGEATPEGRWQSTEEFHDLREVLAHVPDPALVLLGPPGCGKSTMLRRFELDLAVEALGRADPAQDGSPEPRWTFFVPLNDSPVAPAGPTAEEWLGERWRSRFPDLPALDELLRDGRMVLLLDALNEMPHESPDDYRKRIGRWRSFLGELTERWRGSRVVFSCRSLDYSAPLSTDALRVPQVRIERLEPLQVREFLEAYVPQHAAGAWEQLERSPQLELFRLPYYARLLAEQVGLAGTIPRGRAALFTGFVRQAALRELEHDQRALAGDELLTEADRAQLTQGRWANEHELPEQGALFPKLSELADGMQRRRGRGEAGQVSVERAAAIGLLGHPRAAEILRAGACLAVLDDVVAGGKVRFFHQLLQEYFAARRLARRPEAALVRSPWQSDEVEPRLDRLLAELGDSDPLPGPPATGWEETTRLAAAMAGDPDAFVAGIAEVNLPLAARCAAEARVSDRTIANLRRALIERTEDPRADLRARIDAGLALGRIGDPRLARRSGPHGAFLLPPLIQIPGGSYSIGSDEGKYAAEAPVHQVEVDPFAIARCPVTNAEWALFIEAGGYDDERWWTTEAARAWRGGDTAEGPKREWRERRDWFRNNLEAYCGRPDVTRVQADNVRRIVALEDAEFERVLDEWYPPGRQTQPYNWNDDAFNAEAQPVVGTCWHEARAYCAWLAAQTGQPFRLATEVEWEAAARGKRGRAFAYGARFDPTCCNVFETHVRRATPVDAFPGGRTPEGVADLTGNVWEWTSSLYRSYPYLARDGREDPSSDGRRVLRGGSWNGYAGFARAACRDDGPPVYRNVYVGFRVVCSSHISL